MHGPSSGAGNPLVAVPVVAQRLLRSAETLTSVPSFKARVRITRRGLAEVERLGDGEEVAEMHGVATVPQLLENGQRIARRLTRLRRPCLARLARHSLTVRWAGIVESTTSNDRCATYS